MSGRGEAGAWRRALGALARGRSFLAVALFTLIAAAALSAGCGGSSSADLGIYLGAWERVDGGEPDPAFTLTVAEQGDGAAVTFANLSNGQSRTVAATAEDGYLACTLPTGDGLPTPSTGSGSPAPGAQQVPSASDLQLSVDENGQLVVDLVLADGTLEPIWIYDRATASASAEP